MRRSYFVLYVYVYHYFRYMPSNTNLGMPSSIIGILVVCFLTFSAGVLSQFSPPSGDICPGSDIEFSCERGVDLTDYSHHLSLARLDSTTPLL